MELKLNIYTNPKTVEKTYTTDTFELMFGTVEDIISLLDGLTMGAAKKDDFDSLIGVVTGAIGYLKPFLKDVFEGLTDEELRRTKVKELVPVFVDIIKFSFSEIGSVATGKN